MSARWRRDRRELLEWANQKEQEKHEGSKSSLPWGNLAIIVGASFLGVGGLYYFSSSEKPSVEAQLGAVDEEIEVEEEYLEYADDEDNQDDED